MSEQPTYTDAKGVERLAPPDATNYVAPSSEPDPKRVAALEEYNASQAAAEASATPTAHEPAEAPAPVEEPPVHEVPPADVAPPHDAPPVEEHQADVVPPVEEPVVDAPPAEPGGQL